MTEIKKRINKYKPAFCEEIIDKMSRGCSFCQVAADFGVTRETILQWRSPSSQFYHPEFEEAAALGMTLAQAYWERKGHEALDKRYFQSDLWKFHMKNRFKKDYSDSHQITGDIDNPLSIKVEQGLLKPIADMTYEEKIEEVTEDIAKKS